LSDGDVFNKTKDGWRIITDTGTAKDLIVACNLIRRSASLVRANVDITRRGRRAR
jgi:hypothetical protein